MKRLAGTTVMEEDATTGHQFEFDDSHNTIFFEDYSIHLTPNETKILSALLSNRMRCTSIDILIQQVYGADEPDAAAASLRVAIHTLRKKIAVTGMRIRAEPRVGYAIDAALLPGMNRRLNENILVALNLAHATEELEIAGHLQAALALAGSRRQHWINR